MASSWCGQKDGPIGVFDSGVGGISVLRELVKLMPGEDYVYFGDSANAPYGTKTACEVIDLTMSGARFLLEQGAKAIVIACNTATSVAIPLLRETYPDVPIIGVEPALKPAVLSGEHPRVLVMATPMTLEQDKFNRLMQTYERDADILKLPCPGLVERIESGVLEGEVLLADLEARLELYEKETIDAVVLGCTHYPLIRDIIQSVLPAAAIYDGGLGTAKQTRRRLRECGRLSLREAGGRVQFYNSKGSEAMLSLSRRLLEGAADVAEKDR